MFNTTSPIVQETILISQAYASHKNTDSELLILLICLFFTFILVVGCWIILYSIHEKKHPNSKIKTLNYKPRNLRNHNVKFNVRSTRFGEAVQPRYYFSISISFLRSFFLQYTRIFFFVLTHASVLTSF